MTPSRLIGQRRQCRLDALGACDGGLDALGQVGDPVVGVLAGLARPDPLRQLGDGVLQARRVLILVVRLGGGGLRGRRRHREQRDRRALVGPLLGEGARELESCDRPVVDEDLAERLARLLLLDGRLRQRLLRREAELEQDVSDPSGLAGGSGATVMASHPAPDIG